MTTQLGPHTTDPQNTKTKFFLSSGKTKKVFATDHEGERILHFTDNHPIIANEVISGKGVINNAMSALFFQHFEKLGILHHYINSLNMREQLVKEADVMHFRVDIYNTPCDDLAQRFSQQFKQHHNFAHPLFELKMREKECDAEYQNMIISPQHMIALGLYDEDDFEDIFKMCQRINDFMVGFFLGRDIKLLQHSLLFGLQLSYEYPLAQRIILVDEVSLDTCKLLDLYTQERLDVLHSSSPVGAEAESRYQEIAKRLDLMPPMVSPELFYNNEAYTSHRESSCHIFKRK